jgi:succinoglycan biosynthesis transport protein ExoP
MATLQTISEAGALMSAASSARTLATRSVLYAVFKHGRLVVGIFLLVFLASAIAAFIRPAAWRADTKVMVKLGDTVQMAPAEAPSRSVFLPLNQEVVKTEAEIVRSAEVVREAVQRVGVQPEPGTSMDELIANMQLALTVQALPGENVLEIDYLGRDPQRAARMVNAITEVYMEHHNQVYKTEGMHSFYTDQLALLESQMKKAQQRLRKFMHKKRIIDVDQEIQLGDQGLLEQERALLAHRSKLKGAERKLEEVQSQLAQTPVQLPFSEEYHANSVLQTFKTKLAELELERFKLLQAYLPTDRHVQQKDEEISQIQMRMKGEVERDLSTEIVRHNDTHSELQRNLFTLQAHLVDLRVREPGLATRSEVLRGRLEMLRDARFRINNLKQDAEHKAYALDMYRKKQEEARITEAMKNQSMVNVSVVERATPPLQPVNGLLLPLVIGVVGGISLASGLAVGIEYLNRRLRFEEEVERYLEVPVLAVIPDLGDTSAIARA